MSTSNSFLRLTSRRRRDGPLHVRLRVAALEAARLAGRDQRAVRRVELLVGSSREGLRRLLLLLLPPELCAKSSLIMFSMGR